MFDNIYKDKKVLVTGNSGFKGSWLTLWLLKLGAKVSGISLDAPSKPSMFEELSIAEKISHHEIDIRDLKLLENIIKDESPDFIFHLAAQSLVSQSYKNPYASQKLSILKNSVPVYIKNDYDLKSKVSKITSAPQKDGGDGAFYIFLRNKKN